MELKDIPGIGDKTIETLARAEITTVADLLTTFPRTYRTFRAADVQSAQAGDWVVLKGTVSRPVSRRTSRTTTQVSTFWDTTGSLTLRWFNMPYIARTVSPSATYQVKGLISEFAGKKQIISPQLTKTDDPANFHDQIVPVYSSRAGIKPWILRQKIAQSLTAADTLPDTLPVEIRTKFNLIAYTDALTGIHAPGSEEDLESAVRRLSFQELYELQMASLRSRNDTVRQGMPLSIDMQAVESFLDSLPFEPTNAQRSAIQEIVDDLGKSNAMQRLLQGEVGSGKTIVAIATAIAVHSAGTRTVVMAPTQILANQLYENFSEYCAGVGIDVALITAKNKGDATADILVGTQALLTLGSIERVGLVIVDEQHRFGVEQRSLLTQRETSPHLLQMTATPIPRSMAQTVFRYLDITRLTDIPKNRLPVKTYLVPEIKRTDSYNWIHHEVLTNHNQAFIVVPLIEQAEESETAPLKSLKELEITLKKAFPSLAVDIMHGRMKEDEKLEHMNLFKKGVTQILVATSMIEVGIDIPEANIIVIEDAERFGLAQLHQLRGRVGRGGKQGYCLLFSSSTSEKSRDRLAFFIRETNGEKLAQYDLKTRGPGELFGTLQSGFFNLRMGSMYDETLLQETYEAAKLTYKLDR